jgi:hypothetical protein
VPKLPAEIAELHKAFLHRKGFPIVLVHQSAPGAMPKLQNHFEMTGRMRQNACIRMHMIRM